MALLDVFWVHTAQAQTYLGEGVSGPVLSDPTAPFPCYFDTTDQLVVSTTGEQVTSKKTTLYAAVGYASLLPVGSLVLSDALAQDGSARVVEVNSLTSGALGLPDHLEIGLL